MNSRLNKRRLWIALSLAWCFCVSALSWGLLSTEYSHSTMQMESTASANIENEWQKCADRFSPNVWLHFGGACRTECESRIGSGILIDQCTDMEQNYCVQSKVPECNHIFVSAQREKLALPSWEVKFDKLKHLFEYSNLVLGRLAIFLIGPFVFWLLPLTWVWLRRWLYKGSDA